MIHGIYGIDGITLSMSAIIGKNGIENDVPISLSESETEKLRSSASALKAVAADIF